MTREMMPPAKSLVCRAIGADLVVLKVQIHVVPKGPWTSCAVLKGSLQRHLVDSLCSSTLSLPEACSESAVRGAGTVSGAWRPRLPG
jgi:hypothetical protein